MKEKKLLKKDCCGNGKFGFVGGGGRGKKSGLESGEFGWGGGGGGGKWK